MPDASTASDLLVVILAEIIFPLFVVIPGFVLGHLTDVLHFREQPPHVKLAASLALSLACCPIAVYLLARTGVFSLVWIAFGATWIAALAILARTYRRSSSTDRFRLPTAVWIGGALWLVAVALFLSDITIPASGVHRNLVTMDMTAHSEVTGAISRAGVPPINPSFYPGRPVPLFYYYFWYLMCSLVDRLGGALVTPRLAVQGGTPWVGLAVMAVIFLLFRLQSPNVLRGYRPRFPFALALLACTGLDLLPNLALLVLQRVFGLGPGLRYSIEWWNEQVTAWLGAIFMSPHHPAALVACFTGFLLIHELIERPSLRHNGAWAIAAMSFASAFGMSVWVTVTAAAGVLLWLLAAMRRKLQRHALVLIVVAAASLLLCLPYLADLHRASSLDRPSVILDVRAFSIIDYWIAGFIGLQPGVLRNVLRFLALPLNYGLELGFFAAAGFLYWRRRIRSGGRLDHHECFFLCLALGSVLICTFVRSSIRTNDLGWRGFLIAQMVLLVWSAPIAEEAVARLRKRPAPLAWYALALTFLIGVSGTAYELVSMRLFSEGPQGQPTIALRDAYQWIYRNTQTNDVLMYNPDTKNEYFDGLYGHRQAVLAGRVFSWIYGISDSQFQSLYKPVVRLFVSPAPVGDVVETARQYGATVIVAKDSDPVWRSSESWVWKTVPAYSVSGIRVYRVATMCPTETERLSGR